MHTATKRPAPKELLKEVAQPFPSKREVRAWEVVHACDFARDIADVVEAQINAGMRPYLLTVGADTAAKPSIVQAWQDVRRWKKAFDESGAHTTPQLIHAHSFSSGMAAVRMGACLVYDMRQSMEERLAANGEPGVWLKSSFRTAEQFVLAQAAAIATHSSSVREACIERGVAPENVFMIPDPVELDVDDLKSMPELQIARIRATRSPQRIAEMYDDLYRYAYIKRRLGSGSDDASGTLIPIQANL
jgi:hypothetical protein